MQNVPLFRTSDPETSKQAASRMRLAAPSLEAQIIDALTFRSLTDDSICLALNIDPRRWPSVKTARSRLYKSGKVAFTGEVRGNQRVWCLKEHAKPRLVAVPGGEL